jgi:hypothetical protein
VYVPRAGVADVVVDRVVVVVTVVFLGVAVVVVFAVMAGADVSFFLDLSVALDFGQTRSLFYAPRKESQSDGGAFKCM